VPALLVFIPAWNEQQSLPAVPDELPEPDVLVVEADNGQPAEP
jgi:hypothetical protein